MKQLMAVILAVILLLFCADAWGRINLLVSCQDLVKKMKQNNFAKSEIERLLTDPRIELKREILELPKNGGVGYFDPESKLFRDESIERGQKMLRDYQLLWAAIEKEFGVEPEVMVSLFRLETNLGNYIGKYRVFHVLLTMIHFKFKTTYRDKKTGELKIKDWKTWAETQGLCFLKICQRNGQDPHEVVGSDRGAFGYWQFIPTSFALYAVDGDGDGKINLFNLYDAAYSAANYLKKHGWKFNRSINEPITTENIFYKYNNSLAYAKAVWVYALMLKYPVLKL